ncbi:MAG TPA: hypothetical protein VFO38_05775 [Candidatus Saccharimonadales bacterium]|nr:hypothetical protein [Candidatus Saccharimonadales bacterium]
MGFISNFREWLITDHFRKELGVVGMALAAIRGQQLRYQMRYELAIASNKPVYEPNGPNFTSTVDVVTPLGTVNLTANAVGNDLSKLYLSVGCGKRLAVELIEAALAASGEEFTPFGVDALEFQRAEDYNDLLYLFTCEISGVPAHLEESYHKAFPG